MKFIIIIILVLLPAARVGTRVSGWVGWWLGGWLGACCCVRVDTYVYVCPDWAVLNVLLNCVFSVLETREERKRMLYHSGPEKKPKEE